MNGEMNYLDIKLSIDENYLYLNQETVLRVDIKNNSNYVIENGLFRLVINDNILEILDKDLVECTKDFRNIVDIDPGFKISINIPIKVIAIPKNELENIFCYINFHIIKDNNLQDFTYKSNDLDINFIAKLDDDSFNVSFEKEKYFTDEEINFLISIENTTKYPLMDITISKFISNNTFLVKDNLKTSIRDKVVVSNEQISIKNLDPGEILYINIPLRVKEDRDVKLIEVEPILGYIDKNLRQIKIRGKKIKTCISSEDIFNNKNFIYEIDKDNGFIEDIINHKLTIKNTTNLELLDLKLENNFSNKIDFIEDSLIVKDIYRVGESICEEIILGDLEKDEEVIITFKTKVNTEASIDNMKFLLKYKTNKKSLVQESNSLDFKINYAKFDKLSFKKYHSKDILKLNETMDVTIIAENIGTFQATDVLINDYLPSELEFLQSSLYVNNKNVDMDITTNGIRLNSIPPNEKVVINYKAKSIYICTNKKTNASISYKVSDSLDSLKTYTEDLEITILGAKIGNNSIYMDTNESTCQVGDIVTYTLVMENTGNIECDYLKLEIPENNSLKFINESIVINNNNDKKSNIFDGLLFKNVKPNQMIKITYQVEIVSLPRPNPISNKAKLEYCFILENESEVNTVYSNKTKIYVSNPNLSIIDRNSTIKENEIDSFNKICFSGDSMYFNLELQNKGNVGIENLTLNLNTIKHLNVDENSIKVNNRSYSNIHDENLHLPNLNVSQKIYLEFYATHALSKDSNLEVPINLDYTFRDLKNKNSFRKCKEIKENILIANPELEINKFIADKDIEVNSEFTKNINIKNTGNIILTDLELNINESEFLKSCNKIIFINGNPASFDEKVYLNELDINDTINVAIRYNIESIETYEDLIPQSIVTAKYSLGENKEPITIKKKSNNLNMNLKNYLLDLRGISNTSTIIMNTENKYIFNILNKGNMDCDFVKIKIELPKEVSYMENSLCINSKNMEFKKLPSYIDIGILGCNKLANISFDYKVNSLPYNHELQIDGLIQGEYKTDKGSIKKVFQSVDKPLHVENIEIDIIKIPQLEVLQSGDIVQMQTIVNNVGSVDIYNMHLFDNETTNLLFVEDSVCIDGESIYNISPIKGIDIPFIGMGDNVLITYEYEYCPTISSNKIINFSNISYSYKLKNMEEKRITTKSNVLYLEGALSTFKELSIVNEYELKSYEPDIKEIVSIFTSAQIDQYYEIDSMKNISVENEQSTGKKVIIKGVAMDRIEYLTSSANSSLYMLERSKPFSVFINLPNDYDGEEIYFKPKCDNVFYKILGKRNIFVSSLISIEGSF
ncbi:MAG: hypothetical protein RSC53_03720 [Peptostreptococcaceae bacterium]